MELVNHFTKDSCWIESSTSTHPIYNADALLAQDSKFYSTTGMYPQEFLIHFKEALEIKKVVLNTRLIKDFVIDFGNGDDYVKVGLEESDSIQVSNVEPEAGSVRTDTVKVVILRGFDAFSTIHGIKVFA